MNSGDSNASLDFFFKAIDQHICSHFEQEKVLFVFKMIINFQQSVSELAECLNMVKHPAHDKHTTPQDQVKLENFLTNLVEMRKELDNCKTHDHPVKISFANYFSKRIQHIENTISRDTHVSESESKFLYDQPLSRYELNTLQPLTDEQRSSLIRFLNAIEEILLKSTSVEKIIEVYVAMIDHNMDSEDFSRHLQILFKGSLHLSESTAVQLAIMQLTLLRRICLIGTPRAKEARKIVENHLTQQIDVLIVKNMTNTTAAYKRQLSEQEKMKETFMQQELDLIIEQHELDISSIPNDMPLAEKLEFARRASLQKQHESLMAELKERKAQKEEIANEKRKELEQKHVETHQQFLQEKQAKREQIQHMQEEFTQKREHEYEEHKQQKDAERMQAKSRVLKKRILQEQQYQERLVKKQEETLKRQQRINAVNDIRKNGLIERTIHQEKPPGE